MNSYQETDFDIWNETYQRSESEEDYEINEWDSSSDEVTLPPTPSRSPSPSGHTATIEAMYGEDHPEMDELSCIDRRIRNSDIYSSNANQFIQVWMALDDLHSESLFGRVHLIGHLQIFQTMYWYIFGALRDASRIPNLARSRVLYDWLFGISEDDVEGLTRGSYLEYVYFCHRSQRNRTAANNIKDVIYNFMQ